MLAPHPPRLPPASHTSFQGPDWWGEDEHKRVIEAILSMKGNLIGYHTYPLQEPAVWVGLKEQVLPGGNVSGSYPTRWATTLEEGQAWGYNPYPTSTMGFGASQIYEHDCFGHESVSGNALLCPSPKTPQDENDLFNRVGLLWRAAFAHASALGVQTVLGTEIPLAMPAPPAPPTPPPAPCSRCSCGTAAREMTTLSPPRTAQSALACTPLWA